MTLFQKVSGKERRPLSLPFKGTSTFRRDASVLAFALFFPTLLTWAYFIFGERFAPSFSKYLFVAGKTLQFAFPAFIATFVLQTRWLVRRPNRRGLAAGAIFGIVVGLAIFLIGGYLAKNPGAFAPLVEQARGELLGRLEPLGLATPSAFIVLTLFYSVAHSGLEEYYWRWFTFGLLAARLPYFAATLLANAAFALHHILLLGVYFGFDQPATWICSFGVFVGGLVWQEIYRRNDSIYGAWLSHGLIDAGIFAVGFLLLPTA
ncbi:MAG: CPBP family intramembrane metalloprotease [Thermoguttaceae bacterium]|nr:CPBP family intramembrane metalloprotease [Thermoguttaceae bacterium]